MKQRSVGVTVFAVLFIIGGVLGLISLLATPTLLRSAIEAPRIETQAQTQLKTVLQTFESRMGISAVQVLAGLAVGVGLLMLQIWAWWLLLALTGLNVILTLFGVATSGALATGGTSAVVTIFAVVFSLAWSGLIAWFFTRPSVKVQFRKTVGSSQ